MRRQFVNAHDMVENETLFGNRRAIGHAESFDGERFCRKRALSL
jgi:hypothetical protein